MTNLQALVSCMTPSAACTDDQVDGGLSGRAFWLGALPTFFCRVPKGGVFKGEGVTGEP